METTVSEFPCLYRSAQGRIFHCPEAGRVVVDFMGAYLVLRPGEFFRLQEHLSRIAGCGWTRSRFAGGQKLRIHDATGENDIILDFPTLVDLGELMKAGALKLMDGLSWVATRPIGAAAGAP